MGSFHRDRLPDPRGYFEGAGLKLKGRGPWRTTSCEFHGGSDSMRVNVQSGAFVCMAGCGARGGDVLAYHRAASGLDFVAAAKALGAYVDDGKPHTGSTRPTGLSPRAALEVLAFEAHLAAVAAAGLAAGAALTDEDRARLRTAAQRIVTIAEIFA